MPFPSVSMEDLAQKSMKSSSAILGQGLALQKSGESLFDVEVVKEKSGMWVVDPSRWWLIYPFEIVVFNAASLTEYVFALPIPPEAIQTQMVVASAVTPTLGGVVEETSENTFWQIGLRGTMGIAINRENALKPAQGADAFRQVVNSAGMISGALQQAASAVQNAVDAVGNLTENGLIAGLNTLVQNQNWFKRSGVSAERNGYSELLNLHKFLQMYSAAKEAEPLKWSLYFRNHKQNMQWRVILTEFNMQQSKEAPYVIRYSMALKGWDAKTPDRKVKNAVDRFSKDGDLAPANTMTLTGILTKTKGLVNTFRRGPAAIVDSLLKTRPII